MKMKALQSSSIRMYQYQRNFLPSSPTIPTDLHTQSRVTHVHFEASLDAQKNKKIKKKRRREEHQKKGQPHAQKGGNLMLKKKQNHIRTRACVNDTHTRMIS